MEINEIHGKCEWCEQDKILHCVNDVWVCDDCKKYLTTGDQDEIPTKDSIQAGT